MGNILSAIHDDIEEYTDRCRRMGENVVRTQTAQGTWLPDPYGRHAKDLKAKEDAKDVQVATDR